MLPSKEKGLASAKETAARAAVSLIESKMIVGLGTGSTAYYFIELLGKRIKEEGLDIQTIATSKQSEACAKKNQIPLLAPQDVKEIDLTVDGADEVDPQKRLIKGAGGALLREKIIASASRKMVVVVDPSKLVQQLGKCPLPVEIIPFGYQTTLKQMGKLGYRAVLRTDNTGGPYTTDNGNYISDIHFEKVRTSPEEDHAKILSIPGAVETGFFFGLADQIIIGYEDGKVVFQ